MKKKIGKTIYLHIGMGKTGTSALQFFFRANSDLLANEGILYPSTGTDKDKTAHHLFAASLWEKRPYWMPKPPMTTEQYIKNIVDKSNEHNLNKILISSEWLFFIPTNQIFKLRNLLSDIKLKIKIICYIRRIDSFLPSCLHQAIKAQGTIIERNQYSDVETIPFIKNTILGVSNSLKTWLDSFPKENFVIRPYEKEQFEGGNIFSDFLDILGIKSRHSFVVPPKNFNSRLTHDALDFKRLVNIILSDSPEKTTLFINPLLSYSAKEDISTTAFFHTDSDLLSPEIRYNAYKKNTEFYKHIAKEYLNREDGRLFYNPTPDMNAQWEPYPGLSSRKAEKIIAFLWENHTSQIKMLHQVLSSCKLDKNVIISEARNILLPSLERVVEKGAIDHKVNAKKAQPTIYLHIGTANTSTTSIQKFICKNLSLFSEHNYYYPESGRVDGCHHCIAFSWGNHNAFKNRFNIHEDQLSRLSDELHAHQTKNIIISSECLLLSTVKWEELISVFPHKKIRIIAYLSRQDSFITSRYMGLVKGNQILDPPDEWIRANYYPNEYLGILNRLSSYVGKNNIIVRAYERQQFVGGSILSDFCDILSIPFTDDFSISENNFNPHLNRDALEFNRLVNTVFSAQSTPYIFSGLLTQYSLKKQSEENLSCRNNTLFPPSKCLEILTDCEKVNSKIAREYLGREDGRLFFDPLPDPDEPWEPYTGLSEETAEEIVNFLFDKNAHLTVRLYKSLAEAKSDEPYLQEAKEILIPPLSKITPQFVK